MGSLRGSVRCSRWISMTHASPTSSSGPFHPAWSPANCLRPEAGHVTLDHVALELTQCRLIPLCQSRWRFYELAERMSTQALRRILSISPSWARPDDVVVVCTLEGGESEAIPPATEHTPAVMNVQATDGPVAMTVRGCSIATASHIYRLLDDSESLVFSQAIVKWPS